MADSVHTVDEDKYSLVTQQVGSILYVAQAPTGTALATPSWRVFSADTSSGYPVIKWADGDSTFHVIATNLPGLTYT
jgi:hypothetical protein